MRLAFVTGALAAGLATAALVAAAVWAWTLVTGSGAAWAIAPWLFGGAAAIAAGATYLAERVAYRRGLARMRAVGEPWAYRED